MLPRSLRVEPLEPRQLLAAFVVAMTGSDAGPGTAAAPWRTLQKAANEVDPGDSVTVRAGNYVGFDLRTDGTAAAPITFTAEPGVVIDTENTRTTRDGINLEGANYVVIDGFTVNGMLRAGIRSVLNHHVTIRNNSADANGVWGIFTGFSDDLLIENNTTTRSVDEHGIYVSNSGDRPVIRGNTIWGNRGNGIHLNGDLSEGGDGIISGALIENNVIYDNGVGGGSGINGDGLQSSTIRNNLLYNNHASGISLYRIDGAQGAKNNVVVNNTIVQAPDGRWALNIQQESTGNRVFNNILYNNHPTRGSIDIGPEARAGFVSDYNVVMNRFTVNGGTNISLATWRTNTGQDQHSIIATPGQLFVSGSDFHLSTTSPAIDAGTNTLAPTVDLEGEPRPQSGEWDIGAFEFSTGDVTPPTVTSLRLRGSAWAAAVPSVEVFSAPPPGSLPWVNLNVVEIAFDEPVDASAGSLDVNGDGVGEAVTNFTYNVATNTARWSLAQRLSGQIEVDLLNVADYSGNAAAFAGTTIQVTPGDANGDGATTRADLFAVRDHIFSSPGQPRYSARHDLDGSGQITIADVILARDQQAAAGSPLASMLRAQGRRRVSARLIA